MVVVVLVVSVDAVGFLLIDYVMLEMMMMIIIITGMTWITSILLREVMDTSSTLPSDYRIIIV